MIPSKKQFGDETRHRSVSIDGLSRAMWGPLPVAILCAAAVIKLVVLFSILPNQIKEWDFDLYYVSALVLRENQNPYTVDYAPVAERLGIVVTPDWESHDTPTLLLCFEPFTLLPMTQAFWVWIAINVVALGWTMFMLLRPLVSGFSSPIILTVASLMLMYDPLSMNFEYAQRQILISLLLVMAMRSMERGRDWVAGATIAAAGLLRAFPLVLLGYLALQRRWRTLGWSLASIVAGGAITIALVGAPCLDFLRLTNWPLQHKFLEIPVNPALSAFVSRMFWYSSGFFLGEQFDIVRRVAVLAAQVTVLALAVRATLSLKGRDDDWRAYSLWIVIAVMLSPIAWPHYLVLLLIPFVQVAIAAQARRASARVKWMALTSYALIGITRRMGGSIAFLQPYHKAMDEGVFLSLLAAYVAMYWFVTDYRETSHDNLANVPTCAGSSQA